MEVVLPVTRPDLGFWFCTRRVSPECEVLTRVHPNVPSGSMCSACSILLHRYYCAIAKGDNPRYDYIRRVQRNRGVKPRGRGKRVAGGVVRRCGFEGCTRPVHRSMEFGVMVEHRFLCLYHFKFGENLQTGE